MPSHSSAALNNSPKTIRLILSEVELLSVPLLLKRSRWWLKPWNQAWNLMWQFPERPRLKTLSTKSLKSVTCKEYHALFMAKDHWAEEIPWGMYRFLFAASIGPGLAPSYIHLEVTFNYQQCACAVQAVGFRLEENIQSFSIVLIWRNDKVPRLPILDDACAPNIQRTRVDLDNMVLVSLSSSSSP